MYVGHVALALGAKGARPATPLVLLVLAAQGPDWVERALRLGLSARSAELWSHSLPGVAAGAAVVAAIAVIATRSWGAAALCALLYASHLPADLVTGMKSLWEDGPRFGQRLYARPVTDFLLESALVVLAWLVYRRTLAVSVRRRPVAWLVPLALVLLQGAADLVFVRRYQPWRLPVDPVELLLR